MHKLPLFISALIFGSVCFAQNVPVVKFPSVGLASTETVRVSLVNTATALPSGTAASCTGNVAFVNAAGATIGSATNFTVASLATSSVSLAFAQSGFASPRGQVRVVVTATIPQTNVPPCNLMISVETMDSATGVTHVLLHDELAIRGGFSKGRD